MNKITWVFALLLSGLVWAQEAPKVMKTKFTQEVLSQSITELDGKTTTVGEVLKSHHGKIIMIDFWASWCRDCVEALPGATTLKNQNPEVDFVYFSLDRNEEQWKKGIEKFQISEGSNYWFQEGWKNKFNEYIDLNWIPRYLLVDQRGNIAKYYSISPTDPELQKTIDSLKK